MSSPLLVQGRKRPLFCSVPCMPTSHSITSVCGAAVEPLSTLGSGGCLQDGDSSQALDGRSFYEKREMQISGWNRLFSESREQPRSFQMLDSKRLSGGVRAADNIGYLPSLADHIILSFPSGPPGAVRNPQML